MSIKKLAGCEKKAYLINIKKESLKKSTKYTRKTIYNFKQYTQNTENKLELSF